VKILAFRSYRSIGPKLKTIKTTVIYKWFAQEFRRTIVI